MVDNPLVCFLIFIILFPRVGRGLVSLRVLLVICVQQRDGCYQRQRKSSSFIWSPSVGLSYDNFSFEGTIFIAAIFSWNCSHLDTFQSRISGDKHNSLTMLLQCCLGFVFCTKWGCGPKFPDYLVIKVPIFLSKEVCVGAEFVGKK